MSNTAKLVVSPLQVGGTATFVITEAPPSSQFFLCYSLSPAEPYWINKHALLLFLNSPSSLPAISLDVSGAGVLGPMAVPPRIAAGTKVSFQGVTLSGAGELGITNLEEAIVQ